jgi:hypothetical protein
MSSSSSKRCASKPGRNVRTIGAKGLSGKVVVERRTWGKSYFWIGGGGRAAYFQWAQFGGEIRLCTAADIDTYLEAKNNPLYRGICLPVPDEVDNLTMIVKVSSESFNFQSCGLWKGPRPGAKTIADVRLNFLGVEPSHPILAADFQRALQTIDNITFRARGTAVDVSPAIRKLGDAGGGHIKFEHQLFERLEVGGRNRRPGRCRSRWETLLTIGSTREVRIYYQGVVCQAHRSSPSVEMHRKHSPRQLSGHLG